MTFFNSLSRYQSHLLALLRIVAGLLFLTHGLVKLFGFLKAPSRDKCLFSA
jgi:uncharacterized membrane protein YphA (DoxX/SURF4 family)